jgi:hypothetical protein
MQHSGISQRIYNSHSTLSSRLRAALAAVALLASVFLLHAAPAFAQGKDCSGAFTVTLSDGRSFSGAQADFSVTVGAGLTAQVRGKFVSFDVNLDTFRVTNYTLNSSATGNRPAVIFASRTPLNGRALSGKLQIDLNREQLDMRRSSGGFDMKIQAKDCSEGDIFDVEPEADFATSVEFEHVLGPEFAYCLDSLGRVMIVSSSSPLVGREGPEAAARTFPDGAAIVGTRVSRWLVQNGGEVDLLTGGEALQPLGSACGRGGPNATPTPGTTPTPNATPSATPSPDATPSPSPSPNVTPSEIEADLTGAAINGLTPKGEAEFEIEPDGNREFKVRVENVNLPAGTVLRVFVDDVFIGNIMLRPGLERSELVRKTEDGQSVPQVSTRTRVVVADQSGATVLAGAFSNISRPASSDPTQPAARPMPEANANGEVRIESRLAGAAINGLTPTGSVRYRERSGRRDLNIAVEKVNLPADTHLRILIDGRYIGDIVLLSTLQGGYARNTNDGGFVPVMTTASTVVITDSEGKTILSGVSNTSRTALTASNDIDDTAFFVEQQYRDFLGREADDGGLQFWSNQIVQCGGGPACVEQMRVNTSAAFFLSIEFQETGYLLYRLNKASFGTMPRRNPFLVDMQALARGLVVGTPGWQQKLEDNKRTAVEDWAARAEFRARYDALTDEQYVEALLANAGLSANQELRDGLVEGMRSGGHTRASILRTVADRDEFRKREQNAAFVLMQYFGYLHRNPDEGRDTDMGGFNHWLGKLNQFGGDWRRAEMVRAFLSSFEYRDRFLW